MKGKGKAKAHSWPYGGRCHQGSKRSVPDQPESSRQGAGSR